VPCCAPTFRVELADIVREKRGRLNSLLRLADALMQALTATFSKREANENEK
jgi:hypothetical protein